MLTVIIVLADRELWVLGFRHEFNHGRRVLLCHAVPALLLLRYDVLTIVRIPDILSVSLRIITVFMKMWKMVDILLAHVLWDG